jgi:hypothetical protein
MSRKKTVITNYALVLQKLAGFAFWETYVGAANMGRKERE